MDVRFALFLIIEFIIVHDFINYLSWYNNIIISVIKIKRNELKEKPRYEEDVRRKREAEKTDIK